MSLLREVHLKQDMGWMFQQAGGVREHPQPDGGAGNSCQVRV